MYSSQARGSVGALAAPSLTSYTRSGVSESHGGSAISPSLRVLLSMARSSDFTSSNPPSRRRAPFEAPSPPSPERSRAVTPTPRRSRVVETKDADPSRATAIKMRLLHHTRTNMRVIDGRRAFGVLGRARNESLVTRTPGCLVKPRREDPWCDSSIMTSHRSEHRVLCMLITSNDPTRAEERRCAYSYSARAV